GSRMLAERLQLSRCSNPRMKDGSVTKVACNCTKRPEVTVKRRDRDSTDPRPLARRGGRGRTAFAMSVHGALGPSRRQLVRERLGDDAVPSAVRVDVRAEGRWRADPGPVALSQDVERRA